MSDPLLPFPWLDLAFVLALVALNGVLAMSELAIVSSREARLKALARNGSRGAKAALQVASEPGRFLSTVQIGITVIGTTLASFGVSTFKQLVLPWASSVPFLVEYADEIANVELRFATGPVPEGVAGAQRVAAGLSL